MLKGFNQGSDTMQGPLWTGPLLAVWTMGWRRQDKKPGPHADLQNPLVSEDVPEALLVTLGHRAGLERQEKKA